MKHIEFRRKREGKTNYKKRLTLLLSGKNRLVIRKTLKNINIQIVEYHKDGDKIIASANSKELEKKFGWKAGRSNIPASYLTGYLLGKKAIKIGVKEAILDMGFANNVKKNKIYTALKGVIDAGLKVPCNENIFPSEDVLKGIHIQNYAKKLLQDEKYDSVFSSYKKKGIKADDLPIIFEEIKKKIE